MAFKFRLSKFSKIGKSRQFIAVIFIAVFAGLGSYLFVQSHAAPTGTPGRLHVHVSNQGGAGVSGVTVTTQAAVDPNNEYHCRQGTSISSGTTNSAGDIIFTCDTNSSGKTYSATIQIPSGWSLNAGSQTQSNLLIQNNADNYISFNIKPNPPPPPPPPPADSDGDGTPDSTDVCGQYPGPASNKGCPATTISYFKATPNSVAYGGKSTLEYSATWSSGCSINYEFASRGNLSNYNKVTTNALTTPPSKTYTLTCPTARNTGPAVTRTVKINIASKPGLPPPKPPTTTPLPKATSSSSRTVVRKSTAPANSNDSSRPTTPGNLKAEQVGGGEVDLTWDASTDNIAVAGYTLERSSDQATWDMLDDAVTDTTYNDITAEYNTAYTYRVSAKDTAGNFSDYAVVDLTTNEFTANVTADQESTISSDDGIVEATFPAGALSEDAFCEISKDSINKAPSGFKLVAGGYTIVCKNEAGDTIDKTDKDVVVTMHLKSYAKKYSEFAAYMVGDNLSSIQSSFNKQSGDLTFNIRDLQTFAAFGKKSGSSLWVWLLLLLLVVGIIFLIRRLRNGGGGSDDYYDTTDYVTMPPSAPVGPLDTGANGYQHHPSLPELVAQGGQPQQPGQPGPGPQPPLPPPPPPPQPPLPPQ